MVWCFPFMQFCIEHLKLIIMKNLLLLFIMVMISNFVKAQAVQDWTSGLPALANYNNHTIACDSQGNVYSVNTYYGANGPVDFDPSAGVFTLSALSTNMYITKVSAAGAFVWAKQIGGGSTFGSSTGTSVTIDASDNIYVTGSSNKIIASANIDFDPGTGVTNVSNPSGHYVMYILKLDTNGNHIWNKQFYNPSNTQYDIDKMYQLKVDTVGNIYATGCFNGTVDFDPSSTGVFNVTSTTTGNSTEIFILKLNNAGDLVWVKSFKNTDITNNTKSDTGYSIDLDSSGNVYTTGYYSYAIDADPGTAVHNLNINPTINGVQYIIKLDINGNYVWAYDILGQHNQQFLPSIAVDALNNVIVTGDSFSVLSTSRDFDFGSGTYSLPADTGSFVLKIDSNAGFIWAKSTARTVGVSGSSSSFSPGLILDAAGNVYTTGAFGNGVTADFDPSAATFSLTSAGSYDGFISKLDTNGNFVWANKLGGTGLEYCYSITQSPAGKITVCGSTNAGFTKSVTGVITGGYMASYTQPALAINQFELDQNSAIYPNPSSGNYNITINENLIGAKVTVYSLLGQKVKTFSLDVVTTNQNLTSGMYLLEIEKEGNSITKKLLVN